MKADTNKHNGVLVPGWRKVLCRAWSVHLNAAMIVVAVLYGLESVWPVVADYLPLSLRTLAILSGVIPAASILARLVYQRSIHE